MDESRHECRIVKRRITDDSSEPIRKRSRGHNQENNGQSVAACLPPCEPGVKSPIDMEKPYEIETVSELPPSRPCRQNHVVISNSMQTLLPRKAPPTSPQRPSIHEPSKRTSPTSSREESPRLIGNQSTTTTTTTLSTNATWVEKLQASLLIFGIFYVIVTSTFIAPAKSQQPSFEMTDHLIPPNHGVHGPVRANMTLRDFLLNEDGIHLGMAPAFFGYYGYFGALAAWDDELSNSTFSILKQNIKSIAGASAGAMAAILIASGVPPRTAAEFCSTISLGDFADWPGLLTVFRGDKFEDIMYNFMASQNRGSSLQLQDSVIPVSVSGFDLLTMEGKLLTKGSMARAARASACFPFLFQPVGWVDGEQNYLFTDGGIADTSGLNGLGAFGDLGNKKRVVNLVVGDFQFGNVPGPSMMPKGVDASEVVSISIRGLPQCGPWAMEYGPLAVDGARLAMKDALDLPMFVGTEEGHYELHIDASAYVPRREKTPN